MPTLLPRDIDDTPIPAVRFRDGGAHSIEAGAVSARNAAPFALTTRLISLYATGPVYLKCGGGDVTATSADHYFPGGIYYDIAVGGGKVPHFSHIAAICADQDCMVYISEKE